ncbi:MAG: NADH-quinone oxidoreductase subunit K, partial [Desulfobacterales bacterium]
MESVMAVLVGVMVAGSVYLILGRNLIRFIFGLVLASNAVNLLLFTGGRLTHSRPPRIAEGAPTVIGPAAN